MIYSIGEMAHAYQQTFDQLDYVASNIANSNTSGFKAVKLFYPAVDPTKEMSFTPEVVVDYSPGSIHKTDNTLDVAINGDGFFAVQSGDQTAYTRQGSFTLDKDGNLVTSEGNYVLGKSGNKIKLSSGIVQIDENGNISVDGNKIDTLKITNFTNPQALVRMEGCLFTDPGNAGAVDNQNPVVSPGHIELSNVQVVKEMADMIDIHRTVEVYQKVIQTIADQDKLATSQIGKLA